MNDVFTIYVCAEVRRVKIPTKLENLDMLIRTRIFIRLDGCVFINIDNFTPHSYVLVQICTLLELVHIHTHICIC